MKKSFLPLIFVLGVSVFLSGCSKEQTTQSNSIVSVSYKDSKYEVPQKPERIAVLSTSLLNILYAVDGKAIARTDTREKLPAGAESIPTIGHLTNVNTETLLSLKPDLVLGLKDQHQKLLPILDSNHIPHIMVEYNGIHDNLPLIEFLGKITKNEQKALEVSNNYKKNYETVITASKKFTPARVAVLRATGKSVTAETEKAITASMIKELGMHNVLLEHKDIKLDATTVPYSLESISEDNPNIIYIVTMGDMTEINKTLSKEMTGNPAWSQLKAVKENKVFFLPQKLFLLNPGLDTPKAMSQLVKLAYDIDIPLS